MRPDGRVVAMVGGKSYKESPFNRATQARRQPGSAFKLFVYLAAMRAGYTPDDMIEDRPITIDGWTPRNSDGVYRGPITLREAFARSSNAAAVRLAEQVGRDNVIRAARELGIRSPLTQQPSLALGSSSVSLIELTAAYAAIAGGRYPVRPHGLPLERRGAGGDGELVCRRAGRSTAAATGRRCSTCCGRRQTRAPARRAALADPDLRQDRDDAGSSGRDLRRFCRRPGGRGVGRARRQSVARQVSAAGPRRRRSGAPSPGRRWRSTGARRSCCPIARRSRAGPRRARARSPTDWSDGERAIEEIVEAAQELIEELGAAKVDAKRLAKNFKVNVR